MKKWSARRKIVTAAGAGTAVLTAACIAAAGLIYYGYVHVNGAAAGKYPVRGVDVSHYQGEIDWQTLAGQQILFAYIKATEGSSYTDEKFAENYAEAGKTGLRVGAYHFFSFDSPGAGQAEHFIDTVKTCQGMLPPAVDVEFYGNKRENPPEPEQVERELGDYLERVERAYGKRPVIYATEETWELYIRGRFDEYPLWIRNIWRQPGTDGWTFWQYTNRGRLEGFSGEEEFVDLNVFFGTLEQWGGFTSGNRARGSD